MEGQRSRSVPPTVQSCPFCGVTPKRRGKPSNRCLPAAVRELAMSLVCEHYRDFGPTFAAEKLAERHGCTVSRETLREWMVLGSGEQANGKPM